MAPKNFFEMVKKEFLKNGIKPGTRKARRWYEDKLTKVPYVNRMDILRQEKLHFKAFIGRMYMYYYDPKHKLTLPYYDRFPLVIPFDIHKDGWLGLNFHYLPYRQRAILFDLLYPFVYHKDEMDIDTRFMLSWDILKNFSRFPQVKPCVKKYLHSQVYSKLIYIEPVDWDIALFLPVAMFKKKPETTVWVESMKQVRNPKN